MRRNISVGDVLKLNVTQRIRFVEDVWDSIALLPQAVTLTREQKQELNRRLNAYHKNPLGGSPWSEVKKRILSAK